MSPGHPSREYDDCATTPNLKILKISNLRDPNPPNAKPTYASIDLSIVTEQSNDLDDHGNQNTEHHP